MSQDLSPTVFVDLNFTNPISERTLPRAERIQTISAMHLWGN